MNAFSLPRPLHFVPLPGVPAPWLAGARAPLPAARGRTDGAGAAANDALAGAAFDSAAYARPDDALAELGACGLLSLRAHRAGGARRARIHGQTGPGAAALDCQAGGFSVAREAAAIARDARRGALAVVLRAGDVRLAQDGGERAAAAAGDCLLLDLARPWRLDLSDDFAGYLAWTEGAGQPASAGTVTPGASVTAHRLAGMLPALAAGPLSATQLRGLHDTVAAALARADGAALGDGHCHPLAQIRAYIDACLHDQGFGYEAVCQRFALSRSTLFRLFKAHGGFARYLKMRRMQQCFDLLTSERMRHDNVKAVYLSCGFDNAQQFSRVFSGVYGVAPSVLRQLTRQRFHAG
ncbi:helix-turn-helix transcriptional regulator [Bordetella bronchiseptica]|uniref:helix-turn-helix transcriptional regulator n=1 Tax=Bordetella bronchiseptica TaxID=518 RepID=UPI001F612FD1|nr:AraC family transcriptional regulator [Bordetella bronchiseptica]